MYGRDTLPSFKQTGYQKHHCIAKPSQSTRACFSAAQPTQRWILFLLKQHSAEESTSSMDSQGAVSMLFMVCKLLQGGPPKIHPDLFFSLRGTWNSFPCARTQDRAGTVALQPGYFCLHNHAQDTEAYRAQKHGKMQQYKRSMGICTHFLAQGM